MFRNWTTEVYDEVISAGRRVALEVDEDKHVIRISRRADLEELAGELLAAACVLQRNEIARRHRRFRSIAKGAVVIPLLPASVGESDAPRRP